MKSCTIKAKTTKGTYALRNSLNSTISEKIISRSFIKVLTVTNHPLTVRIEITAKYVQPLLSRESFEAQLKETFREYKIDLKRDLEVKIE